MKEGTGVCDDIWRGLSADGCDLAVERRRADTACSGIEYEKERGLGGIWERIRVTSKEGEREIGRPIGRYDTLTVPKMDSLTGGEIDDAKEEIARGLCSIVESEGISPMRILIAGLGNRDLTPDSLGVRTAEAVAPTMQVRKSDPEGFYSLECSEIAVVVPMVSASSGLDAADVIAGVCARISPDVVFAIDSLASRSPTRLGRTVQISSTGIIPGSGVGRHTKGVTREGIGVPVIALGIPTVISTSVFRGGEPGGRDMLVCPREIDGIVRVGAEIIAGGINQAFGIFP